MILASKYKKYVIFNSENKKQFYFNFKMKEKENYNQRIHSH